MTKKLGVIPLKHSAVLVFSDSGLMTPGGKVAKGLGCQVSSNNVDCSWCRLLYS